MSAILALACIDQLGQAQQAALDQGTLACADGGLAWLRVDGVLVEQRVPSELAGIVELRTLRGALQVRPASRVEQQRHLSSLPRCRGLVVGFTARSVPLVWCCSAGELAANTTTPAAAAEPLLQAPSLRLFEQVDGRRDGPCLLFERLGRDQRRAQARALRRQLERGAPEPPSGRGIDGRLIAAYALARELLPSTARRRLIAQRLAQALQAGGAALLDWFQDREQQLVVRWRIAERVITSRVCADTLAIVQAGICVSGHDRDFDLTTLVAAVARPAAGDRHGHDGYYEYGY